MPSRYANELSELLRRMRGDARLSFQTIIDLAKGRANVAALVRAIEQGEMDAIMAGSGIREGMYSPLTENIRSTYSQSGSFAMVSTVPKRFGLTFNINNPRAEAWLRNWSSQFVTMINAQTRGAIQVILSHGAALGNNPRSTALDIVGRISKQTGRRSGGIIGLTEQQAQFVTNMADDLVNFDPRYFDRQLRDRRFDKSVQKSFDAGKPLPKSMRDKIVAGYEDRMLRHRGETIARTETLRALNEANDEAMRQVVQQGLAPANAVLKIWRHSFAGNERVGHKELSGTERSLEATFTNPVTGAVLKYPGDGPASEAISCHCYIENKVDFAAVELARG